jgi:translation initiation factor 2D
MFQKEGSCVEIVASPSSSSSSSSSKSGSSSGYKNKGKGKQNQQQQQHNGGKNKKDIEPTITKKVVVDVPLKKSDRRRLRQRAAVYFFGNEGDVDVDADADVDVDVNGNKGITEGVSLMKVSSSNDDKDSVSEQRRRDQKFENLLDEIFLKGGTISSRSMPTTNSNNSITTTSNTKTKGNHESMVLYVKSSSSSSSSNNEEGDYSTSSYWPYKKKHQFVWMALEDKKSNTVINESPTVALLAVIYNHNDYSQLFDDDQITNKQQRTPSSSSRIVTVPSAVSRFVCRGADLMRAGIINAPVSIQPLSTSLSAQPRTSKKKNNNNNNKKALVPLLDGGKDMVMICVKGNPQPFAVGRSLLSKWTDGDNKPYGYGTNGIGIEIWNCYGDDLWRTTTTTSSSSSSSSSVTTTKTNNVDDGRYGNPGFIEIDNNELYVLPIFKDDDDDDESDSEDEGKGGSGEEDADDGADDGAEPTTTASPATKDDDDEEVIDEEDDVAAATATAIKCDGEEEEAVDEGGEENEEEKEVEEEVDVVPPTPDEILHDAVCQALVNLNLKNNDLPMLVGTFYTKHVLPLDRSIDIKTTSYKKFGNYLKKWQQQQNDTDYGLLKTGPDPSNTNNTDPNAMLLSFNRRHEDLYGMKKIKKPSDETGANSRIVLVTLYTIPNHWTDLLRLNIDDVKATNASSETRKGTGMLTLPEVRKILDSYLERESLTINKGSVLLDGPLTDALYKQKKNNKQSKQQQQQQDGAEKDVSSNEPFYPEKVSRKEISKLYINKLGTAYALVSMPGSNIIKLSIGLAPKVSIEVIRRQSRKFITRLRGLEEYFGCCAKPIDSTKFCKDISKRLAISGSIDADPQSNGRAALARKGYVEYIFGANIVDELEALLTGDDSLSDHGGASCGSSWDYPRIPLDVIDVTLRKGVPARKRRKQKK